MANFDPVDLAYAAGVIDGEGYIGITTRESRDGRSAYFQIVVNVGMVDLEVVAWLHQTFGGGLYSYPPRTAERRGAHHWRISADAAVEFLRMVRPYLRLKHRQAQLVLDYAGDALTKTVRNHGGRNSAVPSDVTERRRTYAGAIRELNQRGESRS